MKISEYTDRINEIEPSGSFISETEVLMKKLRDEKNPEKTASRSDSVITLVTVDPTARKSMLRAAAAAAAVIVCIAAVKIYNAGRADSDSIVGGTMPSETAADTDEPEETTVLIYDTDSTDTISELIVTAAPENSGTVTEENNEAVTSAPENSSEQTYGAVTSPASEETSALTSSEPAVSVSSAPAVTSVPASEISPPAVISSSAQNVTVTSVTSETSETTVTSVTSSEFSETTRSSYSEDREDIISAEADYSPSEDHTSELFMYDDAEEDSEDHYEEDYYGYESAEAYDIFSAGGGISESDDPVHLNGFGDEEYFMEEDDIVEADTENVSGIYAASYKNTSELDILSAADEIYVPDNVSMLEDGTFYVEVMPGFDEYDEKSGNLSGGKPFSVPENETDDLSMLIGCVTEICYRNDAVYSAKRNDTVNYRYKITVCSAEEDERGALMFEIIYNNDVLIINRCDNGTESSEKYSISRSDAYSIDRVIAVLNEYDH